MDITIRPMKFLDLDVVYAIEKDVHIAPWSKEIIRDCMLVGYDCRVLLANKNNTTSVAGYIISRLNVNAYHILNFCIERSSQSKGYGKTLLGYVLSSLSIYPQLDSVYLEVRPSNNAAIALYKKLGFEQVGIKADYYKDTTHAEDAIIFEKKL